MTKRRALQKELHSLEYRLMVASAGFTRRPPLSYLWDAWWASRTPRLRGNTTMSLHGRSATVNNGFAYPAFIRRWPEYNRPLARAATLLRTTTGRPITIVDVGAAVGDTVLLLAEGRDADTDTYICVEPEDEFRQDLRRNTESLGNVEIHPQMLSDREEEVPDLVRHHPGTASPQGRGHRSAVTLDTIVAGRHVDLIKVDTDGYDGKVLAGARRVLSQSQPVVLFEWHPILLDRCGQSATRPFEVLTDAGYTRFVWFTKHGLLDHGENGYDPAAVDRLGRACVEDKMPEPDWHYDVLAATSRHMAVADKMLTHPRA
ncbi:FkbM family methyltransferase [Nostocoides sp. Soil756]|jgi:FkbM family methyltransferase|uniref:FkbM family methyltransferase n=1 Tax=Nostocoides sp. Soil756 TaxID=1736399 RepID=UPI0006F45973|nr:FkbM family methyltransferase [Tetrasphaera sp. Soil756]KRE62283.1 hypothetical protein ASG78_04340 [Tetrasphaera sp. Soil756]